MSERKVLSKYYPPDFDPSKITRTPKHLKPTTPKLMTVRLMAPFSMKCASCGEFIYKGRKFNARKETCEEKYLNMAIYRFYIRCTRCSSEITFKTDPKNMDYTCERGAKRNFEKWRDPEDDKLKETDEERLDRLEKEEMEAEGEAEKNAMEELEGKMEESKREMKVADALDEIRMRNARVERGGMLKEEDAIERVRDDRDVKRQEEEREIDEAARKAFEGNHVGDDTLGGADGDPDVQNEDAPSKGVPTFERMKKPKKTWVSGLKKAESAAPKVTPVVTPVAQPVGLGLGDYDSDDD